MGAEHVSTTSGQPLGRGKSLLRQDAGEEAVPGARENDQSVMALLEGVEGEPWVESIFPPQMRFGDQPAKVGVTLRSLGQQGET